MNKYLYFSTSNIKTCIEIQYIKKILSLVTLEQIPGSINELAGMMNLHGNSIPVYDLGMYLGVPRKTKYTIDNIIILLENEGDELGIIVDKVHNIIEKSDHEKDIKKVDGKQDLYKYIMTIDTDIVTVINVKNLFQLHYMEVEG